jgi:hypothetical protein
MMPLPEATGKAQQCHAWWLNRRYLPGRREQAPKRSGIDDMPESLRHHDPVGSLHTVNDPLEIDIHDKVPVINAVMVDITANADSGVVKHVVKAACPLNRLLNQLFQGGVVCNISSYGCCPAALLAQF